MSESPVRPLEELPVSLMVTALGPRGPFYPDLESLVLSRWLLFSFLDLFYAALEKAFVLFQKQSLERYKPSFTVAFGMNKPQRHLLSYHNH